MNGRVYVLPLIIFIFTSLISELRQRRQGKLLWTSYRSKFYRQILVLGEPSHFFQQQWYGYSWHARPIRSVTRDSDVILYNAAISRANNYRRMCSRTDMQTHVNRAPRTIFLPTSVLVTQAVFLLQI